MSSVNWIVKGCRVDRTYLVINVKPSYGNRRKFEGEMYFVFSEEELEGLVVQIQDRKVKTEKIQNAEAELKEFYDEVRTAIEERNDELRASYEDKKRCLAEKFGIEQKDIKDRGYL